jgi:hypothetical protein
MKYKFQTVVVNPEVREQFTALREKLNSTDKELSLAFWNIGNKFRDELEMELEDIRTAKALARTEKKELKAAAKIKEPKEPKKRVRKNKEQVTMVESNDDEELACVVVDGTK